MAGFENLGDLIRRDPCQPSAVSVLALATTPGRPGMRVIAERLGVNPATVQRAKALGIDVPQNILVLADEAIE